MGVNVRPDPGSWRQGGATKVQPTVHPSGMDCCTCAHHRQRTTTGPLPHPSTRGGRQQHTTAHTHGVARAVGRHRTTQRQDTLSHRAHPVLSVGRWRQAVGRRARPRARAGRHGDHGTPCYLPCCCPRTCQSTGRRTTSPFAFQTQEWSATVKPLNFAIALVFGRDDARDCRSSHLFSPHFDLPRPEPARNAQRRRSVCILCRFSAPRRRLRPV